MTDSKGTPFAQALLERAFSPDTAANHYAERVIKRPLAIRATSPTPSARAVRRQTLNERKLQQKKRSKNKPRPLSAAQKRQLCLNEIPKEQQKYAIYEPLHNLWVGYMREILGLNDPGRAVHITPNASGQMLASADMHGAEITVVRSRCVSRVGLEGIVVRDTRFTFEIITKRNIVKCKYIIESQAKSLGSADRRSDTQGAHCIPLRDSSIRKRWRRSAETTGFRNLWRAIPDTGT